MGHEHGNDLQQQLKELTCDDEVLKTVNRHVGLNANWINRAYHLGPGQANRTSGALYLLDNRFEDCDSNLLLVQCRYVDDNDPYYSGDSFNDQVIELGDFGDTAPEIKECLEQARAIIKNLEVHGNIAYEKDNPPTALREEAEQHSRKKTNA